MSYLNIILDKVDEYFHVVSHLILRKSSALNVLLDKVDEYFHVVSHLSKEELSFKACHGGGRIIILIDGIKKIHQRLKGPEAEINYFHTK